MQIDGSPERRPRRDNAWFDEACGREATTTREGVDDAERQAARGNVENWFLERRGCADSRCTLAPGLINILELRREFLSTARRD